MRQDNAASRAWARGARQGLACAVPARGGKPMTDVTIKTNGVQNKLLWAAVIALGTVSLGIVALSRGETINAAWLVIAAVGIYFVAYRFFALFIANKVL